jgi:uncharacterized protein (DUF1501 family)
MTRHFNQSRRKLIQAFAAASLLSAVPGLSLAGTAAATDKRFVLIILRGAMDGLAAVPPYADADLTTLRASLLSPGGDLQKLDSFFALHPALTNLYGLYQQSQLLVCHAIASPYRERSHFDGQNVLEIGTDTPDLSASGWLNRCIPLINSAGNSATMAIGQSVPAVLQGKAAVASWAPAVLPSPTENTMERLQKLYAEDGFLGAKLEQALMAQQLVAGNDMTGARGPNQNFNVLVDAAARFLVQDNGPSVAVLESNGWDTHANQGASQGQLARKFSELDAGLARLQSGLGATWDRTVVAVVTEFGRTATVNGTQGTDHGTAGVAFVLGGAVRGGRVMTEWPGLASGNLYQQRDLQPTMDLRSLFKGILRDHLAVDAGLIESSVFPDSGNAHFLNGFIS